MNEGEALEGEETDDKDNQEDASDSEEEVEEEAVEGEETDDKDNQEDAADSEEEEEEETEDGEEEDAHDGPDWTSFIPKHEDFNAAAKITTFLWEKLDKNKQKTVLGE